MNSFPRVWQNLLGLLLIFAAVFAQADEVVKSEVKVTYNDFSAHDLDDFVAKMGRYGPKLGTQRVWAMIQWDMNTEYVVRTTDAGCRLVANNIHVVAEITLPRWKNILEVKESTQKWWRAFFEFMETHENGHLTNVQQGAAYLARLIEQEKPSKNCSMARARYLHLKHQALNFINRKDLGLDRLTLREFNRNQTLFAPIKDRASGLVIESGFMRSVIGM